MWFIIIVIIVVAIVVMVKKKKKEQAIHRLIYCDNGIIVNIIVAALKEKGYTVTEPRYSLRYSVAQGEISVSRNGKTVGTIYYDGFAYTRASYLSTIGLQVCVTDNSKVLYTGKSRYYAVQFKDVNVFLRSTIPTESVPEWLKIGGEILANEIKSSGGQLQDPDWFYEYSENWHAAEYVNTMFRK